MKKLILIGMIIWLTSSGNAQYVNNPPLTNTFPQDSSQSYKNTPEWGNYKTLRVIGWSFLGVGIAAGVTGPFVLIVNHEMSPHPKPWIGATIWGTGIALTVASIPILVLAYHYRWKAKKRDMFKIYESSQLEP